MYTSIRQTETTTIALFDEPQNILSRIEFFDFDSKKIDKKMTELEKVSYLQKIGSDLSFFKKFYKRADFQLNIADLSISECAQAIKNLLMIQQLGPIVDHQQLKLASSLKNWQ
jgi:shikimate kinase